MRRLSSSSESPNQADEVESGRRAAQLRRRIAIGTVAATLVVFAIAAESVFRATRSDRRGSETHGGDDSTNEDFHPLAFRPGVSAPKSPERDVLTDPIVIPNCRVSVIHKQDVPSQRDGVLLWVGTEATEGETVIEDRLLVLKFDGKTRRIRLWKEGDVVQAGEILAQMDDRLPLEDVRIRKAKVVASRADLASAQKVQEEAKNRYDTQQRLLGSGRATSAEDVRSAKLAFERAGFDVKSKEQAVVLAESEVHQAETILALYQIRTTIPGIIKTVYRRAGESIHNLEPVVQVWTLERLRVEGQVDVQYLPRLQYGMEAVLEPTFAVSPQQTLLGHLQEINSVAVSKDPATPLVLSASEDGTVRVWDRGTGRERGVWPHETPVRTLACTPPTADGNLCLSGTADGKARLWNLDADSDMRLRELGGQHQGAVTCAAFSLDGRYCVTGGEDRTIMLWQTDSGALRYKFPEGHRAAVTSVQFTQEGQLLSAGRDNTVRLWDVGDRVARQKAVFDRRAGDVACIGASPDGRVTLFDQGQSLRLLSLPQGLTEGVLRQASDGTRFCGFAMYSPDGRLILTASSGDGAAQLWKPPSPRNRGHSHCQLVTRERSETTCATFAPQGSFVVTGTKNHHVLIWPMPKPAEIDERITARLALVEQALDTSTRQIRVRGELTNRNFRLLPGTTVTMAIYPR